MTDTITSAQDLAQYRSTHKRLQAWVDEVAALTKPDRIHWCDGSPEEWAAVTDELVVDVELEAPVEP